MILITIQIYLILILNIHSTMFNSQQTILLEFSGCLNPNNFDIIQSKNFDPYLAQLKQFGKPVEQLHINDDLLRALGIRIFKNTFTCNGQQINIYIFVSQRFPSEIPQVYLSEEVKKNWKYKYNFQNPEEVRKDGKYNLTMMIAKIQNDVTKSGMKSQFAEDFRNLRETFAPDARIKALGKLQISTLTSSKNPPPEQISQQFRISKQHLEAVEYFNQLTMLNNRVVTDIRIQQKEIELLQKKLLQSSYELEKSKKNFAQVFCSVEGIKSRFNKFSIVQWLEDKIRMIGTQIEDIEKKPFSAQNFSEYKALMKQLKKLELRKEKIV